MMPASEEMTQLMGEKNGEQGDGEWQTRHEAARLLIEEPKGTDKFVHGGGIVVRISDCELRTSGQARAKSEKEQDARKSEHFSRRADGDRLARNNVGRNGAPIDSDGNGAARVFWKRWIHEMLTKLRLTARRGETIPPLLCLRGLAVLCRA